MASFISPMTKFAAVSGPSAFKSKRGYPFWAINVTVLKRKHLRLIIGHDMRNLSGIQTDGAMFMSTIAHLAGTSTAFPLKAVKDCIDVALADQAGTQSVLQGNLAKVSSPGSWEPEIDSLVVVELICAIEEQLGVTLPQSFIPRGGYAAKAECVADLVKQTKAVWDASIVQETVDA